MDNVRVFIFSYSYKTNINTQQQVYLRIST